MIAAIAAGMAPNSGTQRGFFVVCFLIFLFVLFIFSFPLLPLKNEKNPKKRGKMKRLKKLPEFALVSIVLFSVLAKARFGVEKTRHKLSMITKDTLRYSFIYSVLYHYGLVLSSFACPCN